MLFNIIPKDLIEKTNDSELVVYFKNGSVYQLKGADEPDSLRGAGPVGVILDEFAKMKYEAWGVIEPILRQNQGWCWFVGTPKGKNHLYDLYNRGQKENKEWQSWLLRASDSGVVAKDQLEEARKTAINEGFYRQEWECDFLEGAGQLFRGVRAVMTATPERPQEGHLYVMGVDLAKVSDYTVITVYDRRTNAQVYQDRFNKIEWPFQKAKIREISTHYNNALVMLDATGIGDPIADDLLRAGVAVEPIKFTEGTKKELIEKLSIWIEQQKIKMLPLDDSRFEFDNFSYEVGDTGRIRYGAPQGYNDDIVIAHALAVWSLQPIINIIKRRTTPIRQEYVRAKRRGQLEGEGYYEGI